MPFYVNFRSQRFVATSVFALGESATLFLVYVCRGNEYLHSLFIGASRGLALAYGGYLVNDTFLPPPNEIPVIRAIPQILFGVYRRIDYFLMRRISGPNDPLLWQMYPDLYLAEFGYIPHTLGSTHAIHTVIEMEEFRINAQESLIFQTLVLMDEILQAIEGPSEEREGEFGNNPQERTSVLMHEIPMPTARPLVEGWRQIMNIPWRRLNYRRTRVSFGQNIRVFPDMFRYMHGRPEGEEFGNNTELLVIHRASRSTHSTHWLSEILAEPLIYQTLGLMHEIRPAIEGPPEERDEESGNNPQEPLILQTSVSTHETDPAEEGPPEKEERSANNP